MQYLLDHPFIKPTINSSPHDSVSTVNNETKPVNHSLEEDSDNVIFLPQASYDLSLGHSRLHQEFDFQEFLGKGGFGNVIKVGDIVIIYIKFNAVNIVKGVFKSLDLQCQLLKFNIS